MSKLMQDVNKIYRQGVEVEGFVIRCTIEVEPNSNNGFKREFINYDTVFTSHKAMKEYNKLADLSKATHCIVSYGYMNDGWIFWSGNISDNPKDVIVKRDDFSPINLQNVEYK